MNILILGSSFSAIHNKLKALGHRLFIIPDPKKKIKIDENGVYEAVHFVQDEENIESVALKICLERSVFNIDRVMAFSEKWQLVAARVASEAGLPVIHDAELVSRTLDKYSMRKHLDKNDFPTIKFEKITHYSELHDALNRVGFPAVLKPLSGEASRDIFLLKDEQSYRLLTATLESGLNEAFLVESFVCGDEYSIEAVSYHNQHHILGITKKNKNENFVEVGHALPAPLSASLENQIKHYVTRFLTVMQFDNCPSHTEIIISHDGPVVIESHTRPGGDNIYRLLELSTGIDLLNLVARINTDDLAEIELCKKNKNGYSAVWYSSPEGKESFILDSVTGVEEAKKRDNIADITLIAQPGDTARPVKNSFDRSAYAIATGLSVEEALNAARDALSTIAFTYKDSEASQVK